MVVPYHAPSQAGEPVCNVMDMRPGPPVKMYIAEDVGRENSGTTTAHAEVRDLDIVACFRVLDGREGRFDRHWLRDYGAALTSETGKCGRPEASPPFTILPESPCG
jgi:hypothetical protein